MASEALEERVHNLEKQVEMLRSVHRFGPDTCTCEYWKIYYPLFDQTLRDKILKAALMYCPWCGKVL